MEVRYSKFDSKKNLVICLMITGIVDAACVSLEFGFGYRHFPYQAIYMISAPVFSGTISTYYLQKFAKLISRDSIYITAIVLLPLILLGLFKV
jgi:hypothetical protein